MFVLFKHLKSSHFYILFVLVFVATFFGVLFGTSYYSVKSTYYFNLLPDSHKDNVNVLLTASDDDGTGMDFITLLSIKPREAKIEITPIPSDTLVKIVDKNHPLKNVYSIGGDEMFLEKIKELTGQNITYYAFSKFSTIEDILNIYDKIELEIYGSKKHLNGKQIFDNIKAIKKNNNALEKEDFFKKITYEFFNQKITEKEIEKTPDIVRELVQNADTNLKSQDIETYVAVLKSLIAHDVFTNNISGKYSNIDGYTYFLPDENAFKKIYKK